MYTFLSTYRQRGIIYIVSGPAGSLWTTTRSAAEQTESSEQQFTSATIEVMTEAFVCASISSSAVVATLSAVQWYAFVVQSVHAC